MKKLLCFILFTVSFIFSVTAQGIRKTAADISDAVDHGEINAIEPDAFQSVWIATSNGLVCLEKGEFTLTPLPSLTHHPFPAIHALEVDTANNYLWIGAWNHLYCYDLKAKRFITIADSLIYQITRLKCEKPGEVLAYTQHGLYLEQLSDSFPEGRTVQINPKPYEKQKPLTRTEVERVIPLNGTHSYLVPILGIVLFTILIILFALIYKRKKLQKTESQNSDGSIEKVPEEEVKAIDPYKESFAERAVRITDRLLSDETFGIERLAQELAVSRAQLFRKMKAANGMTPSEFITQRRMKKAQSLLKNSGLPIADIAMKVGISDVSNFRRTYIKTFGTPPKASDSMNQL